MGEPVLYARMEMRLNDAEKRLAKFEKSVDKNMGGIEKRTQRAAKTMETSLAASASKMGVAFKTVGAGLVAGLAAGGVAELASTFREVAGSVAEIGAEAAKAGLSTKAFQELKYVADQNLVSVDALTDGMKELSLRADEFIVTGKGSGAEAFQRLGLSAEDLKAKIKEPSALFTEIIGKLGALDRAAQIRIADELFGGTGGEQFVQIIARGEQGIREQIKAANDLGIVIDAEVIKRAADVDAKFKTIASTIGSNLKAAVVDAFSALADFVDKYREIQNQTNATLDSRVAEIGLRKLDIENKILETKNNALLTDRARNKALGTYSIELAKISDEEAAIVKERAARGPTLDPITIPPSDGGYRGGASVPSTASTSSSKSPDEYQRATASIREQVAALQAQTAAQEGLNPLIDDYGFSVEKAAAKQDLLNAAKAADMKMTPQLEADIENLANAYAKAYAAGQELAASQAEVRRRAEEAMQFNKDLTRGIVDGFVEGGKAADVFANALKKIGSRMTDLAFDSLFSAKGLGGGGGLFGGFFKLLGFSNGGFVGGYADGGCSTIPRGNGTVATVSFSHKPGALR